MLEKNRDKLVKELDSSDTMVEYIISEVCLAREQGDYLTREQGDYLQRCVRTERNSKLLTLLERSSDGHFNRFVACVYRWQPQLLLSLKGCEGEF
jgi:hypothetical protein